MSDDKADKATKINESQGEPKGKAKPIDTPTKEAENQPRRDRLSEIDKDIKPFR